MFKIDKVSTAAFKLVWMLLALFWVLHAFVASWNIPHNIMQRYDWFGVVAVVGMAAFVILLDAILAFLEALMAILDWFKRLP